MNTVEQEHKEETKKNDFFKKIVWLIFIASFGCKELSIKQEGGEHNGKNKGKMS